MADKTVTKGTVEISAEELENYRKWQSTKDARKTKSTARRKAMAELKKAHAAEYKQLVVKNGGTVK